MSRFSGLQALTIVSWPFVKRQAARRGAKLLSLRLAPLTLLLGWLCGWACCSSVEFDVLSLRQGHDLGFVTGGDFPRPGMDLGWSIPPFPPKDPLRCAERLQGNGLVCQTVETWLLSATFDCRQWTGVGTGTGMGPSTGTSPGGGHVEGPMLLAPCGPIGTGTGVPPMSWTGVRYWCCPGLSPGGTGSPGPAGMGAGMDAADGGALPG